MSSFDAAYQSAMEAFLLQRPPPPPHAHHRRHLLRPTTTAAFAAAAAPRSAAVAAAILRQPEQQQQRRLHKSCKQEHQHRKRTRQAENLLRTSYCSSNSSSSSSSNCELSENQDWLLLRMDLPGVSARDVQVAVQHGVLTIQASRKSYSMDGHHLLKSHTFSRHYGLDTDVVDVTKTTANLFQGVLTICAPKKAVPTYVPITVTEQGEEEPSDVPFVGATAHQEPDEEQQGRDDGDIIVADDIEEEDGGMDHKDVALPHHHDTSAGMTD